MTYMGETYERI